MNKGQSLFEVVVALGISALIITSVVSLVTVSIRNSTYSKNNSLAASYAQQATERLRGLRDANVSDFITKTSASGNTTTYCLPDLTGLISTNLGNCLSTNTIAGTQFIRQVKFITTFPAPSGDRLIEADVTVSWTDAKGTHTVNSATSFSDWRQR